MTASERSSVASHDAASASSPPETGSAPTPQTPDHYEATNAVRFVTAASLFDGHDAAINIMRRILQDSGAEVIHLGHNRSVREVVEAAIEEDAQAIAISSYQGGHMEFFRYTKDLLAELGAAHVKVFGGGGGVIIPEEIEELHAYGIDRIFSPEDGRRLGLQGMIDEMMRQADHRTPCDVGLEDAFPGAEAADHRALATLLTLVERDDFAGSALQHSLHRAWEALPRETRAPVLGVTGTGGAGKSSLVDEILLRFLQGSTDATAAVISVDPSRRMTGGALLGDRIRMNTLPHPRAYMRSYATRGARGELSAGTADAVKVCQLAGFDWVIVETSGIGQGDTEITDLAEVSLYVMTPEYGAPSQLEKIGMLDYADLVAVNKADRRGGEDALRDVRKQVQRNRKAFEAKPDDLGVYGTVASRFCDAGVDALFGALVDKAAAVGGRTPELRLPGAVREAASEVRLSGTIPPERAGYLAEIVRTCRSYRDWAEEQIQLSRDVAGLEGALAVVDDATKPGVAEALERALKRMDPRAREILESWPETLRQYESDETLLILGVAFAAGLSAYAIARAAVRPLQRLAAGAARVALGDLDVRLPVAGSGETAFVTQVFNHMVSQLQQSQTCEAAAAEAEAAATMTEASLDDLPPALPGLLERERLDDCLGRELARSLRHGSPLSVLWIAIDGFDAFAEIYGAVESDVLQRAVGALILEHLRRSDTAGGYGRSAFVAVLTETPRELAAATAERLRRRMEQEARGHGWGREVTLSIGVASFPKDGAERSRLLGSAAAASELAASLGGNVVSSGGSDTAAEQPRAPQRPA